MKITIPEGMGWMAGRVETFHETSLRFDGNGPSPQGNPRAFAKFTMFFLDTIATFKENRNFAD